jgi:hypothetical protein
MQPFAKAAIFNVYFLGCILLRKEVWKLLFMRVFKSPKGRFKRAWG